MERCKLKILIVIVLSIFFTGCQKEELQNQPSVSSHSEKSSSNQLVEEENTNIERKILPLEVEEEQFEYIIGWLNNETILYCIYSHQEYIVKSYNIFSGQAETVYTSDLPILQAILNPSKEQILIHTAPTIYEADVKVIDITGQDIIYHDTIESREISFVWNGYDETKIFVVAFFEDWSFNTYIINTKKQSRDEIILAYPFAVWSNATTLLTLNWELERPNTTAPVISIEDGVTKPVLEDKQFYFLHGWKGIILALSVNEDEDGIANFNFYNDKLDWIQSVQFPHLSNYSSWEVPRLDLVNEHSFFIVVPKSSGEVDMYTDGFNLVKVNLLNGEQRVIVQDVANEPILASPDGNFILYGFQYEKMIQVNSGTIEPFLNLH